MLTLAAGVAQGEDSPHEQLRARLEADTDGSYGNALFEALYQQWGQEELLKRFTAKVKENPADARGYLAVGWVYERVGRLDEAATTYRQALQVDPYYANAHMALGLLFGKQGKPEQAVAEFQQVLELDPSQKGAAYSNMGGSYALLNQHEKAVSHYREAIKAQPNNAVFHARLGQSLAALERFDEAAEAYQTATRMKPDFAQAYQNLALLHERSSRPDRAIEALGRVVQLEPENAPAKEVLERLRQTASGASVQSEADLESEILSLLNQYQAVFGRKDMKAVMALFTEDSSTKASLASWPEGDVAQQAVSFEVLGLNTGFSKDLVIPHDASAVVRERTERLSRTGDVAYLETMATYLFRRSTGEWRIYERTERLQGIEGRPDAFTLHGDEALAHAVIARQYAKYRSLVKGAAGDNAKVVEELKKAIKLSPERADWHASLGNLYLDQGNFKEAGIHYQKALELVDKGKGPELKLGSSLFSSMIHDKLGTVALQKPDLEEAERFFSQSLEMNPENVGALNGLGAVKLAQADLPQAKELFGKSLKLLPGQNDILSSLEAMDAYEQGVPLIDQKRFKEAKEHLRRAVQLRPDFLAAYFELTVAYNMEADALRANNELEEALQVRRESIQFAPPRLNVAGAGLVRGKIYERLGNDLLAAGRFEEAAGEYEHAIAEGHDTTEIHLALATCYHKLGKEERAKPHLRLIIDAREENAQVKELAKEYLAQIEKDR